MGSKSKQLTELFNEMHSQFSNSTRFQVETPDPAPRRPEPEKVVPPSVQRIYNEPGEYTSSAPVFSEDPNSEVEGQLKFDIPGSFEEPEQTLDVPEDLPVEDLPEDDIEGQMEFDFPETNPVETEGEGLQVPPIEDTDDLFEDKTSDTPEDLPSTAEENITDREAKRNRIKNIVLDCIIGALIVVVGILLYKTFF